MWWTKNLQTLRGGSEGGVYLRQMPGEKLLHRHSFSNLAGSIAQIVVDGALFDAERMGDFQHL
jgi:hypothetical protein